MLAKKIAIVSACIIQHVLAYGQVKELKIGDKCPEIELKNIINYQVKTAKLSDFKGKLVILDFWSIWCVNCIKAMPHLEALQNKFGDRIQIFTVNHYSSYDVVNKFLSQNKITQNLQLPCITDPLLSSYFIHNSVPHEVWIDGQGVVRGITTAEYVNEQNIAAILNNEELNLTIKNSHDFDPSRPLLNSPDISFQEPLYYTTLTGYFKGDMQARSQTKLVKDTLRNVSRSLHVNVPIMVLYKRTLQGYPELFYSENRFVLDVRDSSRFIYEKKQGYKDVWNMKNRYCYEAVLPFSTTQEEFYEIMRMDLNRFLRLEGRIESRTVPCMIIIQNSGSGGNASEATVPQQQVDAIQYETEYHSISELIRDLNGTNGMPMPVIDETNFHGPVNIRISKRQDFISDMNVMRKILQQSGLDVVPAERKLHVFVISER